MINPTKLHQELKAAGIQFSSCDSNGRVLDLQSKEIQDRKDVKSVINSHDPSPDDTLIARIEYDKAGVTLQEMVFALWNKVMLSDSIKADELQILIDQVNSTFN